jgi:hypothetical protein
LQLAYITKTDSSSSTFHLENGGNIFLWNTGSCLQDNIASRQEDLNVNNHCHEKFKTCTRNFLFLIWKIVTVS